MGGHSGHSGHLPSGGVGLKIAGWLTGVYFVIELAVGLWSGSIAVISDAFHTFSAVGGVVIALIAARLARLSASPEKSFGWYRAELLGAFLNGGFLLVMAIVVIIMGAMRLNAPVELATGPMLLVAAGGLVTEVISLVLLFRQQSSDLNVRGAYWHILQTFVGSLIIIVAALVIRFTGFLAIDPILGIGFGFVLLWASWGILSEAAHLLMDGTPGDVSLADIESDLAGIDGVRDVHHTHAWALTSGKNVFTAHLRVTEDADPHQILEVAHRKLHDDFGFVMATLQVETQCLDETAMEEFDISAQKK
ncbi:MAG: zinc ABC transporter [Rhodobacteraceae bacterium]|nr:MAG: zinc ABC transporter [Paracoccaceae bacterium]